MSYDEFKRRIDTARNILVGAVPSPAGQIDQITYALIYKFMNDIDDKAASLPGGKRKYFVGDYEKYNWHALMAPSLGAQERLELYRQAIETMSKNDHLPELFRTLYQNAFLPYNSAPVLTMLLKEIEKFTHTDGDDIGDVYEYLLSITGAQGDVGQFRTPRHIIKFIVEAVNPTKDDTVLDPACGTAGFLIAAYLHVKHQHDGKDNEGQSNNETRLSADELDKLHHHYRGFDIDPTMVRTAKVNMYLHDFRTPEIINHDSLSSDDYWNDKYDVILANPPFMTPKGGIQPHKKFSISANRAEVLFVDYIASHLKPTGRAGIIVPEGIIFQSGNAYKQLRKNLVENYLYAVVSLPSGVFNPYAGVKTSILLLDKELAKKRKEILFVKIENDGYSLGAQRRIVPGNQLPYAEQIIDKFKSELINIDDLQQFATDIISHKHPIKDDLRYCEPIQINLVPTDEVTESGDYNLSGDRYLVNLTRSTHDWPIVSLGDELLFKIESGGTPDSKEPSYWDGGIPWATLVDLPSENHFTEIKTTVRTISSAGLANSSAKLLPVGTILLSSRATIGRVAIARTELATNQGFKNIIAISDTVLPEFIAHLLTSMTDKLKSLSTGGTFAEFSKSSLAKVQIPLPPIEVQREIVTELDGYQKIIDAAQTIANSYKPVIKIDPKWPVKKLTDITVRITDGSHNPPKSTDEEDSLPMLSSKNIINGNVSFADARMLSRRDFAIENKRTQVSEGDVLLTIVGTIGRTAVVRDYPPLTLQRSVCVLKPNEKFLISEFLKYSLDAPQTQAYMTANGNGVAQKGIYLNQVGQIMIALPPLSEQKQIVARLESEQKLVDSNKKLIEIYQQKIKSKIAEVWGE